MSDKPERRKYEPPKPTAPDAAQRVEQMGEPLGAIFYALRKEVAWLYAKWQEYVELFGEDASVDLLNKTAPLFFRVVQDALWHDILIHIARLTDPAESGVKPKRKPNLTILCLRELVRNEELDSLVKKAIEVAKFARDWRNRRIAHRDLNHALSPHGRPLATANRKKVEEVLSALAAVLNWVEQHHRDGVTVFSAGIVTPPGGAKALLAVLEDGLKAREQREQQLPAAVAPPLPLSRSPNGDSLRLGSA